MQNGDKPCDWIVPISFQHRLPLVPQAGRQKPMLWDMPWRKSAVPSEYISFSPVLDVNTNSNNPIIGARSFGSDPDLVNELGVAVVDGIQDKGVLACGKHFQATETPIRTAIKHCQKSIVRPVNSWR